MLGGISTPTDTSGYPTSCKGKYIITSVSPSTLNWNTVNFIINVLKNNNVLDKFANSKAVYLQLPKIIFVKNLCISNYQTLAWEYVTFLVCLKVSCVKKLIFSW